MKQLTQNERDAIFRLIASANQDTSAGLRVSRFLLAWWSEDSHDGFKINDAWGLSDPIRRDMGTVFSAAMRVGCFPSELGFRDAFQTLADDWLWHPTPIRPAR